MDIGTQLKFEKTAEALEVLQQNIDRIDRNIKQLYEDAAQRWEIQLGFMKIFAEGKDER